MTAPTTATAVPRRTSLSLDDYRHGILNGDRSILARAITLIESSKPDHQALAQQLLQVLLPDTGNAHRIGITGVPGVGKSTMIEQLGVNLTSAGHKVAVLAVDPTSSRKGGSILGDKTRMAKLSQDPNAYIRPSPSSGTLGGVTRKTRETMALCEAFGFDVIIVETVGVGQSETAVADMVDFFLVLMLPGAGDELQGIKKGIIEIADMIAVNKADGEYTDRATRAAGDYRAALMILTPENPDWIPPVVTVSGQHNIGLDVLWTEVENHRTCLMKTGAFDAKRKRQAVAWMHDMLEDRLLSTLKQDKRIATRIAQLEEQVGAGTITPVNAANEITALLGLDRQGPGG